MIRIFFCLILRDLRLMSRTSGKVFLPALMSIMTIILFTLGAGTTAPGAAAGILALAIIIPALFAAERLYRDDIADGTMDFLMLSSIPTEGLILAKSFTHWCVTGLPVLIILPLLLILLGVDLAHLGIIAAAMGMASLIISLITTMVQSIIAGSQSTLLLLATLAMPLMIPVMIFTSAALTDTQDATSALYLLGALLSALLPIAPILGAIGLRNAVK